MAYDYSKTQLPKLKLDLHQALIVDYNIKKSRKIIEKIKSEVQSGHPQDIVDRTLTHIKAVEVMIINSL